MRIFTKAVIAVTVLYMSFQIGRVYSTEKVEYIETIVKVPEIVYIEMPVEPESPEIIVELEPEPKTYNGITEGDIITGSITHYDVCMKCCGKMNGITASGLKIQNGVEPEMPVAACNWLPFDTLIEIDGTTYIVADRGGNNLNKIGRIDVFVPEGHQAAVELGVKRNTEVKIIQFP